jgi:pyruvate,orthophosphate dikinase
MGSMPVDSSTAARDVATQGLDAVLDEHAELRDLQLQLAEATDLGILSGLLQRLRDLLQAHFAREEAEPELHRLLAGASDPAGGAASGLLDEHCSMLATLEDLIARIEADPDGSLEAFEHEVDALLARLARHDARETELFGAHGAGEAASGAPEHRSRALEVNLRRTAVDVVIPAEHALLLELTEDQYGVHESTRKLLREINHRYVGWPQTLEELHRRAMGDLSRYLATERAPEAIGVFLSLYAKVAEHARPPSLRETAIRQWFYYLEKLVAESGDGLPGLASVLKRALSRLGALFGEQPRYAVVSSPRLRRFAQQLLASPLADSDAELSGRALELLASSLRRVYERWIAQPDPAAWWREQVGAAASSDLPDAVAAISRVRLEQHLALVERLGSPPHSLRSHAEEILGLPDDARIERGYLDAAASVEVEVEADEAWRNHAARIRWLTRVLSSQALSGVHEQALGEIHHAYRDALAGADPTAVGRLLRDTFAGLRRSRLSSSSGALGLISRIGVVVLASGHPELAQVVVDEMLAWDFPGPGFSGFGDEWQVRVDPAHLRAIRAFLAVIEQDPELALPLIAGLVVHLKLGGVFVADTDLFQKDVSRLLNSGIGPVYHPVKQLLELFPVYFNEIGAEGEMREVSSRIDEITGRKDPLVHFLRKQCHVESNPQLVRFIDAIGEFWSRGDRAPLHPFVPPSLYERLEIESESQRELHRIFSRLVDGQSVAWLADQDAPELERRLARVPDARPLELEKSRLLIRLRRLLSEKYALGHGDLLERIAAHPACEPGEVDALRRALDEARYEQALDLMLGQLERLKRTITSEERTEGFEDIYRKRHIAVGIPSMYGRYREEKFEALGLSFRIESAASALFERLISQEDFECVTRTTLRRARSWLRLLLRAVRVDGCRGRGLERGISMLDQALSSESVSIDQYVNIVQIISRSVEQLIRIRFIDVYQEVLERIVGRSLASEGTAGASAAEEQERVLRTSDEFLRGLVAGGFGLQPLDRLIAKLLHALVDAGERLDRDALDLLLRFDSERCLVPIEGSESPPGGAIALGNKGYLIEQLARCGLPVPPGFILTTDLFRCWPAIRACPALASELRERVRREIARLERLTGSRFGDPRRPLLLSVRSGAAMSMPGVLDTFLNVGINREIAEGLSARSGSSWGAWDAYRRFLQFWGMGHGIPRDCFDDLMRRTKAEFGATKKAEIPADAMQEVASRYRRFVEERGVRISDDPTEQLERCIGLVLRSWDAPKARVYRSELQIAEEWGTAVIVQSMVYGNLNERSGTGVALTGDSRSTSGDISLSGDFIVQGQGDDVVSGLVETLPIGEQQGQGASVERARSLERDFPRIHRALLEHARVLIRDQGMFHQELEFTFESDDPADLYILQARDRVMSAESWVSAFLPGSELDRARLGSGIGAGGGALSGRVAHSAEDLERLRESFPDDPLILLRPDTVPDDIPLVLQAAGVVTSLGGATSHAALVAQQLGRTCVVGCRELQVDEQRGCSQLGDRTLATGDFISISGIDGSVYLGKHPSAKVRRRQLV